MRNYVLKDDLDVRAFEHPALDVRDKVEKLVGGRIYSSDIAPGLNAEFFVYKVSLDEVVTLATLLTYSEKVEFCEGLELHSSFIRST